MARVLVVDDDPVLRDVLSIHLMQEGHVIRAAGNGAEALRRLKEEPFDLVLSDVDMPAMDGLELARAMRSDPALRQIPLVLLSARRDDTLWHHAQFMGALFVAKPVLAEELHRVVERSLARRDFIGSAAARARARRNRRPLDAKSVTH
jgi:CheY-like chemotaxis protein